MAAFGAFGDFSDFLESISCKTSKTCQVPWFESMPGANLCNQQLTNDGAVPCTNFVPTPHSRAVELIDAVLETR
jgi:hypothetical protein